jgi:thiamine biosynthesis lipoprotein ApbE
VIAPSATDTDALSTAIFVLGRDAGQKMLGEFSGASAMWVFDGAPQPQIVSWHWPQTIVSGTLSQQASVSGRTTNP